MGSKRYANVITFTVEGHGIFPTDMLRYDACYPATEADSYATGWDMDGEGIRKVTLRHRVLKDERIDNYPTEARWASFSWRVVPRSIQYDK